jgi:hypothetical protein
MKTDRELLELAAMAVGMEIGVRKSGLVVIKGVASIGTAWNPLTDDSDSRRLQVTLGLCIEFGYCLDDAPIVKCGLIEDHGNWVTVPAFPDPHAATRRVVVLAAAAIGEQA